MGSDFGLADGMQSRASGWGPDPGASPSLLGSFCWWVPGRSLLVRQTVTPIAGLPFHRSTGFVWEAECVLERGDDAFPSPKLETPSLPIHRAASG